MPVPPFSVRHSRERQSEYLLDVDKVDALYIMAKYMLSYL
jgi:hypothetical protein